MASKLTIELSEELEHQLAHQAAKLNLSLENLIIQFLSQSVSQDDVNVTDPILPLIGTLSFEASDLGENHDRYLNQALQKEIKLGE